MRFLIISLVFLFTTPAFAESEKTYTIVIPASQLQKLIDLLNRDPAVILLNTLAPQIAEQNRPKEPPK